MQARRLHAPALPEGGGTLELPAEAARHARVLRLAAGDAVELFDGGGGTAQASILELSGERLRCRAEAPHRVPRPTPALHLLLGTPKRGKLESVVRMLAELGVESIQPVQCKRSVSRPGDMGERLARLERITLEACAQSGQPHRPELRPPAPLLEAAAPPTAGALGLVFWERSGADLASAMPAAAEATCVIGPEGGLEQAEVEALAARGYRDVGLGEPRLRVETAAPVIAALVLARQGRL